jgi:tripartite-type tricarboxylate transporter receptor subunit TctC
MRVPPLNISRRALFAGLGAALAAPSVLRAQSPAPSSLTLIVPFAAGGPTDIVARLAAEGMARQFGRPIVVENVGGAGGAPGTLRAARARPDGGTMVLGQMATHALTPLVAGAVGYDPIADFEPIGLVANAPMVIAAKAASPADTLAAFRALLATSGSGLSFGHAGPGATSHVACELVNMMAGVMPVSVSYRGTAPALTDLVAGHIDFMCDQLTSIAPQVREGKVKGLALMARERSPVLPNLPTAVEQGFPELVVEVWNGLLYPRGTPRDLVQGANRALLAALSEPALATRLIELGASAPPAAANTPEAFGALIVAENRRWGELLGRQR